jgi:hypothetical protein
MNFVLHHFLKEFRYLWSRWLVFLMAVGFDLALQLHWLFPTMGKSSLMLPSFVLSLPMWIAAWWLMLSVPPEDMDGAFRGTRPLPRRDYWLARIMTGVLLVMLPLLIENAAFLLMSGRGWADVRSGMLETGFAVLVLLLWVLPAGTLFRGWEKYAALLLFFYGGADSLSRSLFQWMGIAHRDSMLFLYDSSVMRISSVCLAPLVIAFACWHHRRPFRRVLRLGLPVLMGLLLTMLGRSVLIPSLIEQPHGQAVVDQLVKDRQPVITADEIQVSSVDDFGKNQMALMAQVGLDGIPPEIVPCWHVVRSKMTQKGQKLLDATAPKLETKAPLWELNKVSFYQSLASHLPTALPQGTLAVMQERNNQLQLIKLGSKTDTKVPITLELDLAADWMRLREFGRTTLKSGASIRIPDSEIEVLEVIFGANTLGTRDPEAVTLRVRERHTTFAGRNGMFPISPRLCLLGKDKRLLWQQVMDGVVEERGANHGWVTIQRTITFLQEVLCPGTGVTAENLAEQELVWIGGEYLGTSRHEVNVENFVLSDLLSDDEYYWPPSRVSVAEGNPREAFLKHVRSIPRPQKGASKEAASQYLAAVYAASQAFYKRYYPDKLGQPRWSGSDKEVAELLAPMITEHPDLIASLRISKFSHHQSLWSHLVIAALVKAKIPGYTMSPSGGTDHPGYFVFPIGTSAQSNVQSIPREPWIYPTEQNWPSVSSAIIQALKTHSDVPMRRLIQFKQVTSESIWKEFSSKPILFMNHENLKRLLLDPVYRDKAKAIVKHEYQKLPRVALFRNDAAFSVIGCNTVLGDLDAFDLALRTFGLFDETDLDYGGAMQNFHLSVFGRDLRPADFTAFIQNCRRWTTNDFRYDAEKMRWELNPNTKP